jgi:uncharacterized protein (DUF433 family)
MGFLLMKRCRIGWCLSGRTVGLGFGTPHTEPVATTVYYMIDCFHGRKPMPWIVSDADHLGGSPRVRDTRIAVALLLEWLAAGMTIDEIVREYPSLTEEAVRGTLKELAESELLAPRENPPRREHA